MSIMSTNPGKKSNLIPIVLIAAGLLLSFTKPILSLISPVKLDVQIHAAPVIMPSIYKVYANSDALEGKYSLFKMIVTNNSSKAAENVEVFYQIPGYIENMSCQKIPKILSGQTIVVNCYPSFPDKIAEKMTPSKENVNITIKGSNIKTIEESFSIPCKGRNEFMYSFIPADEIRTAAESFDNKELLSCLITPDDPIMIYFTQKIQEKILKGDEASVSNDEREGVRFMMGIYEATYRMHMVYGGTSGVPEKIGDVSSITQKIHLPREVVTGNSGLCIELSLLYASIMLREGMDPVIYLVPGHAYPGFIMNDNYYAIEATGIGGENLKGGRSTAQQAYEMGNKEMEEFRNAYKNGDPRYSVLYVKEAIKNGAVAMELKDDNFLRTQIDQIGQKFDGASVPSVAARPPQGNDGGGGNGGGNDGGGGNSGGGNTTGLPSGYNLFEGVVTFGYPGSWKIIPRSSYTMPQCKYVIANGAKNTYVEVYSFPGYNSAEQAMKSIQQYVTNMGSNLQYQSSGQSGGYTVFNGTTSNNSAGLNWVAAFKNTGNGIGGIAVGAYYGINAQATAQKILGTLR